MIIKHQEVIMAEVADVEEDAEDHVARVAEPTGSVVQSLKRDRLTWSQTRMMGSVVDADGCHELIVVDREDSEISSGTDRVLIAIQTCMMKFVNREEEDVEEGRRAEEAFQETTDEMIENTKEETAVDSGQKEVMTIREDRTIQVQYLTGIISTSSQLCARACR